MQPKKSYLTTFPEATVPSSVELKTAALHTNTCDAVSPSVSVIAIQANAILCCCCCSTYLYLSPAADAINNAAGFGFNGYNKDGSPRWDLISNLRILDIEVRLFLQDILYLDKGLSQLKPKSILFWVQFQFATSFKSFLDNWNIQTALWLKR